MTQISTVHFTEKWVCAHIFMAKGTKCEVLFLYRIYCFIHIRFIFFQWKKIYFVNFRKGHILINIERINIAITENPCKSYCLLNCVAVMRFHIKPLELLTNNKPLNKECQRDFPFMFSSTIICAEIRITKRMHLIC